MPWLIPKNPDPSRKIVGLMVSIPSPGYRIGSGKSISLGHTNGSLGYEKLWMGRLAVQKSQLYFLMCDKPFQFQTVFASLKMFFYGPYSVQTWFLPVLASFSLFSAVVVQWYFWNMLKPAWHTEFSKQPSLEQKWIQYPSSHSSMVQWKIGPSFFGQLPFKYGQFPRKPFFQWEKE